jgi:hypothetical protein
MKHCSISDIRASAICLSHGVLRREQNPSVRVGQNLFPEMKSFLAAIFAGLSLADRDCAEGAGRGEEGRSRNRDGVGVEDGKERGDG